MPPEGLPGADGQASLFFGTVGVRPWGCVSTSDNRALEGRAQADWNILPFISKRVLSVRPASVRLVPIITQTRLSCSPESWEVPRV